MYDDHEDGFEMERAYDRAVRERARMQAVEDRDTGEPLEPLPPFDVWLDATQCETEDDA
jgi:hypothetical protein